MLFGKKSGAYDYIIAGLGNPGAKYEMTRHNAGFKAIDELARQAGVTYWKNQAGAEVALININDPEEEGGKRQIVLVKPQSYMNTSGGPISKLCREYKIKAEELLVIHDELDIPAGDVRVKVGGGHAGTQAALAAAQLGEGFGVACIACQMEAAKTFYGDDGPFM